MNKEEMLKQEVELFKEIKSFLIELVDAARPFTSGDTVDETTGTIPLMDRLDEDIESAERLIKKIEKENRILEETK